MATTRQCKKVIGSMSSHTARVVWNLEHSLQHYLHAAALVQALHKTFSQGLYYLVKGLDMTGYTYKLMLKIKSHWIVLPPTIF